MVVSLATALLVGSFSFQMIGTAAHPAEVSAQLNSCTANGTSETCSLTLANVGGADVQTMSCAVGSDGGDLIAGGGTVPAGGTLRVNCVVAQLPGAGMGIPVIGWIGLSNGVSVYFVGSS